MITLKDIAEKAGVSSMTVSRVMNGKTKDVSEKTAERIRKIADELGYVPNSSARALASRNSRLIAALLFDYGGENNPLEDSYNSRFFGEFAKYIQKEGYDMMLHYVKDYGEINYSLKSWNVAGAVFIGMFDENIKKIQEDNTIPLIFTDSYSTVRCITNVGIDDFRGGQTAARYFLEKGHRNLAFMGPAAMSNGVIMHRLQGFCSCLRANGVSVTAEHIIDSNTADLEAELGRLSREPDPVTGIFVTADACAYRLYSAAYRVGLRIPDDISIIGFDDLEMSSYMIPPLTTVRQDIRQKAAVACRLLMDKIRFPQGRSENIMLDVNLVERDSVKDLR